MMGHADSDLTRGQGVMYVTTLPPLCQIAFRLSTARNTGWGARAMPPYPSVRASSPLPQPYRRSMDI